MSGKEDIKTLIGLVVLFLLFVLPSIMREHKFNNRTSTNGYKTDFGAMNYDLTMGMFKNDVKDKFNRGGYDVPDKK